MAKPTKLPRWATGGSADILEPSEGQKDDGWAAGQKPPAQWWDWLLNLIYLWIVYLDDGDIEHVTFTTNHAFHGTTHVRVGTHATLVDGTIRLTTGLHEFGAPLQGLRVGDTLESVRFRVKDDNTDFITCGVRVIDASGTDTQLATANSTISGVWEWVVVNFTDHVVVAGDRIMVTVKNGEPGGAPTGNMDASMYEVSHKRE